MSLAAARGGGGGKGGWSSDQLRWDAALRGHESEALTCRFGGGCRQGLNCPYRHSQEEIQIFEDERDLRRRKLLIRCGFCARGECKFEGCCARSLRVAAAVPDAADSDYESADSNDCADGCAGDGSASDSGSSGEEWRSGSEGVLSESEEEYPLKDRRPSRREAIRGCIYSGELQQSGGRYAALINDGGPDDGLLCPEAGEGAELEVDKPGFAFACREKELECGLTEEEWGWAALQGHGGAEGEAGGQTEAVERPVVPIPGVGAVRGTGEAPSEPTAAVAPQVAEKVSEGVPAPGASVRERRDWFQAVVQQFEDSEMGVVWKQRRQEWEAEGWMQPAVWDQCLEWIDGQWGAVDGLGRLETLLDEIRYGAGAGLVVLQLWQWRQQQFGAAVGWWRQQHLTWRLLVRQGARQRFGSAVGWWTAAAAAAAATAAAEWQSWSRVVQADGRAVEAHLERVQEGVQEAAEGNRGAGRSGELSCGGRAGGGSDVDGLGTGQGEESTGGSSNSRSDSSRARSAQARKAAEEAAGGLQWVGDSAGVQQ